MEMKILWKYEKKFIKLKSGKKTYKENIHATFGEVWRPN